jgi:hypothetical protein
MTRVLAALVAIAALFVVGWQSPASAEGCSEQIGILGVNAACAWTYPEYTQVSGSDETHTWVVAIQCGNGGICAEHVECNENGETGFMHDVYMDGTDVGDVCVPGKDVDKVNIAKLILREFKSLSWPASELIVQPPGGRTLVNFETNFYTLNAQAIPKLVTVAGQAVEIRATPTAYRFNFGDGMSTTSRTPGRPHPDLDITHVYQEVGAVAVSLDTTYSGEYRIGAGDWVPIADTLTVSGAPQALEVVEAIPQLVLR